MSGRSSNRGSGGKGQKGGRSRPPAKKAAKRGGKGATNNRRGGPGPRRSDGQRGTTPIRAADEGRGDAHLGGDQVEGRHAVRELLMAGTRRTREVILAGDLDPAPILDDIIDLADEQKVTLRELSRNKFESMTRTEGAQGVLAMAQPLRSTPLEELLDPERDGTLPFLLLLDGITDPGNLGAILRTAECAGVTGVVLPRHRAAHITPTVAKTAAGAIEHLRIAVVGGLPAAMKTLTQNGIWTAGLDAGGDRSLFDLPVADEPIALALGAEGPGLSRLVRERCDTVASIPMAGVLDSLNVSNAAAVAVYEITRRRSEAGGV
ncbi:MAG: 23S rRNA (guanosine(2251)-2'-O)-methyltransferase RlmB [Acidimicrobiales bacterium]|nr:23S rRNA (guanosine(2251)-2'-O)-methyltransferase RlmB [Acidimicrobiales bacterium]